MHFKPSRTSVSKLQVMLVMTLLLAGCQVIPTTQTAAIKADKSIADNVCSVWKPVTYSSKDTQQTQLEVRANNAAQAGYCKTP